MSLFDLLGNAAAPRPTGQSGAPQAVEGRLCSRKGCRADARVELLWNNPRIHTPERRKIWLACAEHAQWLENYLQERALWKETRPLGAGGAAE